MRAYQAKTSRGPAQVFADIKAGKTAPVYIIFGADRDSAAVDDIIAALKGATVAKGFEGFDFESTHAEDTNVHIFLQHVNQPPMGPGRRMAVIRDIHKLSKKDLEDLCRGLARPPDFATVVATAEYEKKLAKIFSDSGVAQYVVNVYEPKGEDLVPVLRRWAQEQQMNLTPEAAALLRDIAGSDTALLRGEVAKLATAVGKDGKATVETVREIAANSREYSLREYTEKALARNAKGALAVLRQLFEWGEEPIRIIYWLVTGLVGIAGNAETAGSRWPIGDLNRALHRLYVINRKIVTGYPEPYLLLEAYTVCLACRGTDDYCRLARAENKPEFCLRSPKNGRRRKAANGK